MLPCRTVLLKMKEKLVELLKLRVGLDQPKAEKAVDTIMEHIKANPVEFTTYLEKFKLGAPLLGRSRSSQVECSRSLFGPSLVMAKCSGL